MKRLMRNILVATVLLLAPASAQTMTVFDSPQGGFRLHYPAAWTPKEGGEFGQFCFGVADKPPADKMAEHICLEISTVSDSMGMEMLGFMRQHEVEERFPGAALKDSKAIRWGSMDAQRFVYSVPYQGQETRIAQVFGVRGKKSYTLCYIAPGSTFDRHQSWFENILNKFEVKK